MPAKKKETKSESKHLAIPRPDFRYVSIKIIGSSQYVQHRFGERAMTGFRAIVEEKEENKKGRNKKREPKDFEADYRESLYRSSDGWFGIPCGNFRDGMVFACRSLDIHMTHAKQAFYVVADGYDTQQENCGSGIPLTRITKGEPLNFIMPVRNSNKSTDIRARGLWMPGWEAVVTIRYDAEMMRELDIVHLLMRAGLQCGIGEGRVTSPNSRGMGWGFFEVEGAGDDDE